MFSHRPSPSPSSSPWTGPVNWYYVLSICVIGCGSIPKGWDEGGFSAATSLPSFMNEYELNPSQWTDDASGLASRKADITSLGVLGACFGSLLALAMADRVGRLRSWQALALVYMSGFLMQVFASGVYGFLLFARVWAGLGAGGLTVVGPLYLSEVAPAKSRGMIVSISMVFLLSFLSLGFFINYAANVTMAATRAQYRLVIAVPLIPVGLALIASLFISDTPRWLASKDRGDEALAVLARLRHTSPDDHQLQMEYAEIQEQIRSQEKLLSEISNWDIAKEIWTVPSYRQRFFLATVMQTVAQWSGGNGITYYIPQIFQYAGVTGHNTSLITSGVYGLVKLVFTMVFTWGLVDVIGRRRCFLYGLSMQLGAHIFMAVYMGVWVSHDHADKRASEAAIASVFIYAIGWSIGLCTVQFLYGTEIFPTRIRNVCYAFNMALHWLFQFSVVRVTPNMFVSLHIWGTYAFYAGFCAVGLVVLGLWAPETKGVPMELVLDFFQFALVFPRIHIWLKALFLPGRVEMESAHSPHHFTPLSNKLPWGKIFRASRLQVTQLYHPKKQTADKFHRRMGELFSGHWWVGWKAKVDLDHSDTQTLRRSRASSPADFMEKGKDHSDRGSLGGPLR